VVRKGVQYPLQAQVAPAGSEPGSRRVISGNRFVRFERIMREVRFPIQIQG
jgi:hypothetical protein